MDLLADLGLEPQPGVDLEISPASRRKRADFVAECTPLIPAFSPGTTSGKALPPAIGRKWGDRLALGRFGFAVRG